MEEVGDIIANWINVINLSILQLRLFGLVVWFLLRVQEVPGSIPGTALAFYFDQWSVGLDLEKLEEGMMKKR